MADGFYAKISEFNATAKGARKKVVVFLSQHPEEAAFMTIEGLAASSGVSAGMVSRTVREMGFDGFADMQEQIRRLVRKNITPVARLQRAQSGEGSFRHHVRHGIKSLANMLKLNAEETFVAGAGLLASAPAVHILGLRSSYVLAYSLALGLRQIREKVYHMRIAAGLLAEEIKRIRQGDVFVVIAFPRYQRESLLMTQEAKQLGCSIIALTDGFSSPLAMQADVTFLAPFESPSYFNSPIAGYSVISTLLGQTARILGTESQEDLEHLLAIQNRWRTLVDSKDAWDQHLMVDE